MRVKKAFVRMHNKLLVTQRFKKSVIIYYVLLWVQATINKAFLFITIEVHIMTTPEIHQPIKWKLNLAQNWNPINQ